MRFLENTEFKEMIQSNNIINPSFWESNKQALFFPFREETVAFEDSLGITMQVTSKINTASNSSLKYGMLIRDNIISLAYVNTAYSSNFSVKKFIANCGIFMDITNTDIIQDLECVMVDKAYIMMEKIILDNNSPSNILNE